VKGLLLAALLACALPAHAQDEADPRLRRLAEINAIAPESRTIAQIEEIVLLSSALLLEHLVEALPEPDRAKLAGLHAVIRPVDGGSPILIQGKEIRISEDYLGSLFLLTTLLTHDLSVTYCEPFETSNPLLEQPFAVSALAPQMSPLRNYLDSPFIMDLVPLLSCPPSDTFCSDLRIPAFTVILSFAFHHEMAHVLLGHGNRTADRPLLEEELAADAAAWPLTQRMLAEFRTEDARFDHAVRMAFLAGPILPLQYELFGEEGQETPGIARRRDALLALIPEDQREEVVELVLPQRSARNVGRLTLHWEQFPRRLWIDGVEIPPAEVKEKELLVASGRHRIFAWSDEGIAYESVRVGGARRTVALKFRQVAETPVPLEKLQSLQREHRWLDLLLQTSDASLKPREKEMRMLHAEALRFMGLADLIEIPQDGLLEREQQTLRRWKMSGAPLLFWW
jgi:hypothetical protein